MSYNLYWWNAFDQQLPCIQDHRCLASPMADMGKRGRRRGTFFWPEQKLKDDLQNFKYTSSILFRATSALYWVHQICNHNYIWLLTPKIRWFASLLAQLSLTLCQWGVMLSSSNQESRWIKRWRDLWPAWAKELMEESLGCASNDVAVLKNL